MSNKKYQFVDNIEIKSAKDFKNLFETLPTNMQNLSNWLEIDFIVSTDKKKIANTLEIQHAGKYGEQLIEYGLMPSCFSQFVNYFVNFLVYEIPHQHINHESDDIFAVFNVDGKEKKIYLSDFNNVIFISKNHLAGIFKWSLELMKLKSDCIKYFHVKYESGIYHATLVEEIPNPMMYDMYDMYDDIEGNENKNIHPINYFPKVSILDSLIKPFRSFFFGVMWIVCTPSLIIFDFLMKPFRYLRYMVEKKIWENQRVKIK